MLTTWFIFWNTKPSINLNCNTYAKLLLLQTQDYHKCPCSVQKSVEMIYGKLFTSLGYKFMLWFQRSHFLKIYSSFADSLLQYSCLYHDFMQNGDWKPLFSFFHLPKYLPSHPPLTTHLRLAFLLSPTVFKLFLLALSLSCHPRKAAGFLHL